MTKQDVRSAIATGITRVKPLLTEEDIADNDNLNDDIGLDSLDMVELIMDIERTLEISVPDESINDFKLLTVGELAERIYMR